MVVLNKNLYLTEIYQWTHVEHYENIRNWEGTLYLHILTNLRNIGFFTLNFYETSVTV